MMMGYGTDIFFFLFGGAHQFTPSPAVENVNDDFLPRDSGERKRERERAESFGKNPALRIEQTTHDDE